MRTVVLAAALLAAGCSQHGYIGEDAERRAVASWRAEAQSRVTNAFTACRNGWRYWTADPVERAGYVGGWVPDYGPDGKLVACKEVR